MKINRVVNSEQSFKGLHIDKLYDIHFKNHVEPCLPKLQELAQKADVFIASRWNPHLQAGVLEYAVRPFDKSDEILRWGCIGAGYNKISSDALVNMISNEIKKLPIIKKSP